MPRRRRVLLVDDDDDSRELYALWLGSAGYEVLQAGDGAEGIEKALRGRPDVIVMDLDMPVMGGIEAIARLRADLRTQRMPIAVLSGNNDQEEAKRAGCNLYLVKPCRPLDLEDALRVLVACAGVEPAALESKPG